MSYIDRFQKRKNTIRRFKEDKNKLLVLQNNVIQDCNITPDYDFADKIYKSHQEFYSFEAKTDISDDDVREFLEQFKSEYNQQCFANMINQCRKEIINTIVTPFGLGHIVSAYDKVGGNVDTIHNVRNGIYATEEEKQRYENRGAYDSNLYHKDPNFIQINAKHSENRKKGQAVDYITGEKLTQMDVDHIVSANEIHNDPARILAEVDGRTLANTDSNLAPMDPTLNRSKKQKTMSEFIDAKNKRLTRIQELEAKNSLSSQEQNELKKLKKMQKINDEMALEADKNSRDNINRQINKAYYRSEKFVKNVAKTSLAEAGKMGIQQAVGVIMVEFFTLLFDEVIDIYKNGFRASNSDESMLTVLKARIKNIQTKLEKRWKDLAKQALEQGVMGSVSAFISNLSTVLINIFTTTSKRFVRIIREGFFSVFRAVKLLLFPPNNMTFEDAFHEAKKLIVTSVIASVGISVEECINKLLIGFPIIGTFNLSSILIGATTAFAIALATYYIDKKRNEKNAINELTKQVDEGFNRIDKILCEIL